MKKSQAFTLIELLTVIVIIGLLITIVAVALNKSRVAARDTKRKEDIQQVANALQLYYQDKQVYPSVAASAWEPVSSSVGIALLTSGTSTYLSSTPADPWTVSTYFYEYCAENTAGGSSKYAIRARMEQNNTGASIGTADYTTPCANLAAYATKNYYYTNTATQPERFNFTSISSGN